MYPGPYLPFATPPSGNPVAFPSNVNRPLAAADTAKLEALPKPVSSGTYIVLLAGSHVIQLGCPPMDSELFNANEYVPLLVGVNVKLFIVPL